MTTRIQTFGPKQVHEMYERRNNRGAVRVERYEYYAEAVGSDGRMYYATGRARPTPFVEEQERFREMAGATLEKRMREEGVWEQ